MIILDKKVSELLNDQINKELYSAYLYLDSSFCYQEQGLDGFVNWYMAQMQEERDRAVLLLRYLQDNGEHITLKQVDKPDKICSALRDPLEFALEYEHYVTSLIHTIYDATHEVKDYHTIQFLGWFAKKQDEEEKNVGDIVKKLELFDTNPKSLYTLDNEMVGRAYSAPSLVLQEKHTVVCRR